jgi:hypothetical protein
MSIQYANLVATGEDTSLVLAHVMHAVHGFNANRAADARIAAAFPGMQDAVLDERGKLLQPPVPGSIVRIFGDAELLQAFMDSATPLRLARMGALIRSVVLEVPPFAGAIRFVRDRAFERGHRGGAYARRQKLRAAKAGREYFPAQRSTPRTFGLQLRSKSTSNAFFLDVRKEPATHPASLANISAYGLCAPGSAVPSF